MAASPYSHHFVLDKLHDRAQPGAKFIEIIVGNGGGSDAVPIFAEKKISLQPLFCVDATHTTLGHDP